MKNLLAFFILLYSGVALAGVSIVPNRADDGREIIANNRIPDGYTMMFTGASDDVVNDETAAGEQLVLNDTDTTAVFQVKSPWYAIGGHAVSSNITLGDYLDATLVAPATTGLTQASGDFDKVEIAPSSGLYMIVPASPGEGAWDMDLTAKIGSSQVTKATPVPNDDNQGWFSYDIATNTITACSSQTCGYDLFDFDVTMFTLCSKCWINPQGKTVIESSDVVAKKMLPQWQVHFSSSMSTSAETRIIMSVAVKSN